jgi:hypothetical protein
MTGSAKLGIVGHILPDKPLDLVSDRLAQLFIRKDEEKQNAYYQP